MLRVIHKLAMQKGIDGAADFAGNDTLTFWVGKNEMEVNGRKKEIGANVVLMNGRTQVPLRFITELLGWDVKWNDADWSISLTKTVVMGTHSH